MLNIIRKNYINHLRQLPIREESRIEEIAAILNATKFSPAVVKEYIKKNVFYDSVFESYTLSPAYYAMTGRKSRWIYEKNGSAIVVCRHPNVPDILLAFPPLGDINILSDIVEEIPREYIQDLHFCRVPVELAEDYCREINKKMPFCVRFKAVKEDVLDWLYPCCIISTFSVAKLRGGKFLDARNKYNQLTKNNEIRVEKLTTKLLNYNKKQFDSFLKRWEENFDGGLLGADDWSEPLFYMLRIYDDKEYNLDGTVVFCNGQMESVNIYEKPVFPGMPANFLVPFFNTEIKGLSEFVFIDICKRLHAEGIALLDIGGSETEGLDRYKRKFNPVSSRALCTIKLCKD
ncbi:MAG: hypothetical protein ACOC3T_04270 [Bacteroidota bacterium]